MNVFGSTTLTVLVPLYAPCTAPLTTITSPVLNPCGVGVTAVAMVSATPVPVVVTDVKGRIAVNANGARLPGTD